MGSWNKIWHNLLDQPPVNDSGSGAYPSVTAYDEDVPDVANVAYESIPDLDLSYNNNLLVIPVVPTSVDEPVRVNVLEDPAAVPTGVPNILSIDELVDENNSEVGQVDIVSSPLVSNKQVDVYVALGVAALGIFILLIKN